MLPESKVNNVDEKLTVLNPATLVNTLLTLVVPLPTVAIPMDVFETVTIQCFQLDIHYLRMM